MDSSECVPFMPAQFFEPVFGECGCPPTVLTWYAVAGRPGSSPQTVETVPASSEVQSVTSPFDLWRIAFINDDDDDDERFAQSIYEDLSPLCPDAGSPHRLRRLVYLRGFVPRDCESQAEFVASTAWRLLCHLYCGRSVPSQ
jgi:hypothetical protein